MSGRSCSLASSVFFEAIAVADEPTRERGGFGLRAGGGDEFGREFRHGDVVLRDDAREQKRPMRLKLSMATAPARLGREPPARDVGLHQIDNEGH